MWLIWTAKVLRILSGPICGNRLTRSVPMPCATSFGATTLGRGKEADQIGNAEIGGIVVESTDLTPQCDLAGLAEYVG